MNNKELLATIKALCEEAGVKYLVQVDDGEHVDGMWHCSTNTRLEEMVEAVNRLSDNITRIR